MLPASVSRSGGLSSVTVACVFFSRIGIAHSSGQRGRTVGQWDSVFDNHFIIIILVPLVDMQELEQRTYTNIHGNHSILLNNCMFRASLGFLQEIV